MEATHPQTHKSALDIQSLINNTDTVERKFYETVTASSSEDESNTDEEPLPRIIPTKEVVAPSSIDILCNAAASAISAQKDLKGYPDHLEVLKETRTYVFFGPSRKDNYQKYFKAVYSRERNFRIEEGYKVVLEGHSDSQQVWNVILIGQATNRHLWVWLHKHDSDVLMRPISEIVDVVGRASQEEMNTGLIKLREKENSGAHSRREKRKDSYDRDFAFPKRFKQKSDPESSQDSPTSSPHNDHHHHPTAHHYPPTIVNGHPIPYGFPGSPGSHPIINSIAPIEAMNGYKNTSSPSPYLFPYMYMQPPTLSGHNDVTINQNWRKYLRAQLLRMVHELDALDSFEAKKNDH